MKTMKSKSSHNCGIVICDGKCGPGPFGALFAIAVRVLDAPQLKVFAKGYGSSIQNVNNCSK